MRIQSQKKKSENANCSILHSLAYEILIDDFDENKKQNDMIIGIDDFVFVVEFYSHNFVYYDPFWSFKVAETYIWI
jgi:hypothetical protein